MNKPRKPTIWIINQFAGTPLSGWGERHYFLSEKFKQEGYRVVIISTGNNHMFKQKANMKGLFTLENYEGTEFYWVKTPSYNPRSPSRFLAMFYFAFALLLLPFKISIIGYPTYLILSSMSIFPVPSMLYLKMLFNAKKFIFEVRDLWPLTPICLMGYSRKHPFIILIAWLEKLGYRKADEIVSVLKESDSYINPLSGDQNKFSWIPNGIYHDDLIKPKTTKGANINIPEDVLVITYMGTLGFANALDPFIALISDQQDIQAKVFFLIVGDGYLKSTYQKRLDGVQNIKFISKVPKSEVQSYLKLTDVCFIAWHDSILYNYGVSANKYFDYLASAKPILSAQSGINDPVVQSKCGLVVANETEEIRKGIKFFLNLSSQEINMLGQKGLSYAQDYTYLKLGARYLEIIER